jgi:hypothetical protein
MPAPVALLYDADEPEPIASRAVAIERVGAAPARLESEPCGIGV